MSLATWNGRLHDRYAALKKARGDSPVFAIEHGLTLTELAELKRDVSREVIMHADWLPWIVYATEYGYEFGRQGHVGEYWTRFKRGMPRWGDTNAQRSLIRDFFKAFHTRYGGISPPADRFPGAGPTIIGWPITNALLPADMRLHFARAMREFVQDTSAYSAAQLLAEPSALEGRLLGYVEHGRLAHISGEPAHVLGRLAAALLDPRVEDERYVSRATVERILADIAKVDAYVTGAIGRIRTHIDGVIRSPHGLTAGNPSSSASSQESAIRANYELRQLSGEWVPYVSLPSLESLSEVPRLGNDLRSARWRITGEQTWRPAGSALAAQPPRRLASIQGGRQLLELDAATDALRRVIDPLITPPTPWLFRIASDGVGRRATSLSFPAEFVAVGPRSSTLPQVPGAARARVAGGEGIAFRTPSAVGPGWEALARALRVDVTQHFEVWPAGRAAAEWTDGHGVWIDGDTPRLGVSTSLPLQALEMSIGPESIRLESPPPRNTPLFLSLGQLPVGEYRLRLSGSTADGKTLNTELNVTVRPTRAPGALLAALGVVVEVQRRSVADVVQGALNGDILLVARGPVGHPVEATVSLVSVTEERTDLNLTDLAFPVTEAAWTRALSTAMEREDDKHRLQVAAGTAVRVELSIDALEFGLHRRVFERTRPPFAWRLSGERVALAFEGEISADLDVSLSEFANPAAGPRPVKLPYELSEQALGGIFVARGTGHTATVALVAPRPFSRFPMPRPVLPYAGQRFEALRARADDVSRLIGISRLWRSAGIPVQSSAFAQAAVMQGLGKLLVRMLAGDDIYQFTRSRSDFARLVPVARDLFGRPSAFEDITTKQVRSIWEPAARGTRGATLRDVAAAMGRPVAADVRLGAEVAEAAIALAEDAGAFLTAVEEPVLARVLPTFCDRGGVVALTIAVFTRENYRPVPQCR
ncbi:MAG: hypothetical protein JWM10_716 [Myxococcaceae bacterium]|nr:hypothetical protein [Myxococcaceae bacterium]